MQKDWKIKRFCYPIHAPRWYNNEYIIRDSKYYLETLKDRVHTNKLYTARCTHLNAKLIEAITTKPVIQTTPLDNTMRLNVWPLFSTKYLKEFKTRYQKQLRELKKRNERQCKKLFVNIQVTKQLLGKILSIGVTAEC